MITFSPEIDDQFKAIIHNISLDEPLVPENIDLRVNRPEVVVAEVGEALGFFEDTELDVTLNVAQIETLLTDAPLAIREFLPLWGQQEPEHGMLVRKLREESLGMPSRPLLQTKVDNKFILAGKITEHVPGMEKIATMDYVRTGAMHERQTAGGYRLLSARLKQLGETSLAKNLIRPILRQEGGHSDFYNLASKAIWAQMNGFQRRVELRLTKHFYNPVGVHSKGQQAGFGKVAMQLLGENPNPDSFTKPVEALAAEIFEIHQESMPRFVLRSIMECIEDYRATVQNSVAA